MSSSFIDMNAFKKLGVPVGKPSEDRAWQNLRGIVEKKPYDKQFLNLLETMSFETYLSLMHCDPMFRSKIWDGLSFSKLDDPILSNTPDVWQALYGTLAHAQIHREMTLLSALQMVPWVTDGARLFMADPTPQGAFIAEEDYMPEPVKPDFDVYACDSKWAMTTWEIFEKAKQHAARNEGIDLGAELMQTFSDIHREFINVGLLANAQTEAGAAGANRYATAPQAVESIDRIISSDEEEAEHGGSYTDWYDPYATDIDREDGVGTDHNSVVLMDTSADRPITDALMKQLIRECEDLGMRSPEDGGRGFILTGRDTRDDLAALHQAAMRYTPGLDDAGRRGIMKVHLSVEGVRTTKGYESGFKVASYDGYPIIVDKHCPADGKSRIYLIDGNTLRLKYLLPSFLLSTGPQDWIVLRQLKSKYAWLSVLELECLNFRRQGKIRDLA